MNIVNFNKYLPLFLVVFVFLFSVTGPSFASVTEIETLADLDILKNKKIKQIRNDIKTAIYTIKSFRDPDNLPQLKFFRYRVKKDDTFWKILSSCSLDIDTLMTLNYLSAPRDIVPGKIIHIPNMRGIVIDGNNTHQIQTILAQEKINPVYVYRVNNTADLSKKYIFIPCGKITRVERSLFLGTGFIYPLKYGRRTSGFGSRRNPFNRTNFQFHSGVDIACPLRSKTYAARSGKVIFSGYKGGYGRLVIISHEHGYLSYYGHLSASYVKPGQEVKRGQVIALSGNSGRTTGPHLHFEVRRGKKPINPGVLLRY